MPLEGRVGPLPGENRMVKRKKGMVRKKKGAAKKKEAVPARESKATGRKKNVLITGVTGTVGSRLAEALYYDRNVGVIMGVALGAKPYYFNQFDTNRFRYKNLNILTNNNVEDDPVGIRTFPISGPVLCR